MLLLLLILVTGKCKTIPKKKQNLQRILLMSMSSIVCSSFHRPYPPHLWVPQTLGLWLINHLVTATWFIGTLSHTLSLSHRIDRYRSYLLKANVFPLVSLLHFFWPFMSIEQIKEVFKLGQQKKFSNSLR